MTLLQTPTTWSDCAFHCHVSPRTSVKSTAASGFCTRCSFFFLIKNSHGEAGVGSLQILSTLLSWTAIRREILVPKALHLFLHHLSGQYGNTKCYKIHRACASRSHNSHLFHFCPKPHRALLSRALETTQLETKEADEHLRKTRNLSPQLLPHTQMLLRCHCCCLGGWWISLGGPGERAIELWEQWCPRWFHTSAHKPNFQQRIQYMAPSWSLFQPLFQAQTDVLIVTRVNQETNELILFFSIKEGKILVSLLFFKLPLKSHFGPTRSSVSILW